MQFIRAPATRHCTTAALFINKQTNKQAFQWKSVAQSQSKFSSVVENRAQPALGIEGNPVTLFIFVTLYVLVLETWERERRRAVRFLRSSVDYLSSNSSMFDEFQCAKAVPVPDRSITEHHHGTAPLLRGHHLLENGRICLSKCNDLLTARWSQLPFYYG